MCLLQSQFRIEGKTAQGIEKKLVRLIELVEFTS
jgi:hypothetical protein